MKYNIMFFITGIILLCSCEGMHEKTEKYYGEIVYPAKFDTIAGHIGYERVEIDLLKAGRIASDQIKMGKAKKMVVEYDEEKIVLDELRSWVNITGLTQSKIYRFFIYTMDEYDNKSVSQEIALIPFTLSDLESVVITSPRITTSPSSAVIEWPAGLNSLLLSYYGLTYEYTDKDGKTVTGERGEDPRFFISNLETGTSCTVKMKYKILPKVNNESILDTLIVEKDLTIQIPAGTGTFSPAERDILIKNGLSRFDFESAAGFKKLTYPIQANSLQDIFYFPNIEELDLTGGDLFELTTYTYDRNDVRSQTGGGKWLPFVAKVGNVGDVQVLKDLLEAGALKKVRYIPHSMGLDDILAPYVESGIVELVDMPDEVLIPNNFVIDGRVQDGNFEVVYTYNPADAPAGDNLQQVYKVIPKKRSASFVIALPTEYRFNAQEYKYLKYRIYAPAKSDFTGANANFQSIWVRFMNYMWAFGSNSSFGQEYWAHSQPTHAINDADLQKWVEYTLDLSEMTNRHNRVIIFNIGGEKGVDPERDMIFYFADFRFSKNK